MGRVHEMLNVSRTPVALGALLVAGPALAAFTPTPEALYASHCLSCHGDNRQGGMGPPLHPDTLTSLDPADAARAIADGRPSTRMPAFADSLQADEIRVLTEWIYTPARHPPNWDASDIEASRTVNPDASDRPAQPVFEADSLNLTLAVEHGGSQITLLDGDAMAPIARFPIRAALHGSPVFSPDGRFAHWASRDGWVTRFDLWTLKVVAETRVGLTTRTIAISSDGRYVMAANDLPRSLVALNARDLTLIRLIPAIDKLGKTSRISALHDAHRRNSFIVTFKDLREIWEIPYDGRPVYKGLVHDYRLKEALPEPGPLPVRQIALDDNLDDIYFDPTLDFILGTSAAHPHGQVIHLGVGRKIADLDLPTAPSLGSGVNWMQQDAQGQAHRVMAVLSRERNEISVLSLKTWQTIRTLPLPGAGVFLRSHENSPYVWISVVSSESQASLQLLHKSSLEIIDMPRPVPDKPVAHIEFTGRGKYALLTFPEPDGALIVYDAKTLKMVRRLPMKHPVGSYNVWTRTRFSGGARH